MLFHSHHGPRLLSSCESAFPHTLPVLSTCPVLKKWNISISSIFHVYNLVSGNSELQEKTGKKKKTCLCPKGRGVGLVKTSRCLSQCSQWSLIIYLFFFSYTLTQNSLIFRWKKKKTVFHPVTVSSKSPMSLDDMPSFLSGPEISSISLLSNDLLTKRYVISFPNTWYGMVKQE